MKRRLKYSILIMISLSLLASCSNSNETNIIDDKDSENSIKNDTNQIEYLIDQSYDLDLNGDGILEQITYTKHDEIIKLSINDKEYVISDLYADLTSNEFEIVDLDKNDGVVEIVFSEASPPADNMLHFYRYVDNELMYIGNLVTSIENLENEVLFDGNGEVQLKEKSNLMSDGYYMRVYNLNDEFKFEEENTDNYYKYADNIESTVNKAINIYNKREVKDEFILVETGEKIIVLGEINNYLKIKWQNQEYWIDGAELDHFPDDNIFQFDGISFWS